MIWEIELSYWINENSGTTEKINSRIVTNLYDKYLIVIKSIGAVGLPDKPNDILFSKWDKNGYLILKELKEKTGYNHNVINTFLLGLYQFTKNGRINYKIYDPYSFIQSEETKKVFFPNVITSNINKALILGVLLLASIILIKK